MLFTKENLKITYQANRGGPLNSHAREIRLLVLHPDTEPVSSTLITVSLDDKPKYVALSYCWGSSAGRGRIFVNGNKVEVTRNLVRALCSVRSGMRPLALWCDRLCINQDDPEEKSWQINLMAAIYTQASSTTIWLGPGCLSTNQALDWLRHLNHSQFLNDVKALEEQALEMGRNIKDHFDGNLRPKPNRRGNTFTEIFHIEDLVTRWNGLHLIMTHPWWGRRWVIQEAFFSRNPLVQCGDRTIRMDTFAQLAVWHQACNSNGSLLSNSLKRLFNGCPFYDLLKCWKTYRADPSVCRMALPRWMFLTRHFNQSLARDMVFGLLSLSSAKDQLKIKPDYRSPDDYVFGCLCGHLVETYGLSTLQFSLSSRHLDFFFPSWCDRWTAPSRRMMGLPLVAKDGSRAFKACGDTRQMVRFTDMEPATQLNNPYPISKSGRILAIHGFEFDEIAVAIPTGLSNDTTTGSSVGAMEENFRVAVKRCQQRLPGFEEDPYKANCGRLQAICLTLLTNQTEKLADHEWLGQFNAWLVGTNVKWSGGTRAGGIIDNAVPLVERGQEQFYRKSRLRCFNRALIITMRGFLGLAPFNAQLGDVVAILHGSKVPFVLRKDDKNGLYSLLGESYIHGIMYGEAIRNGCNKNPSIEFLIK
ncbi:HET-domain-containing protein [Ustulina deusta]|nr:HET-domain-containing protein [Ustulina deusta]